MTVPTALLVGAAPGAADPSLISRLAANADLLIAVDGGASVCLAAGLVPAFVIGDFDSLEPRSLSEARAAGSEVIRFPAEKDETDLDLALRFAADRGVQALALTGVLSDRVDHTIASAGSLCRSRFQKLEVVEPDLNAWVVREGVPALVIAGAGCTVSVMAVCDWATVSVSGVRWPLEKHRLEPASSLGLSNLIVNAEAVVEVHSGSVLVLSPSVGSTKPAARISRQRS